MIVLDAYAVLALLKAEPAARTVERLLTCEDDEATLTALGVAEILDHLVRIVGTTEEDAALDLAQLGLLDPPPVDPEVALRAGLLRARHYHRRSCAVSLADCVAAQTARASEGQLATSDPHLLDVCHRERIDILVLPDSQGRRWKPTRAD